MPEGGSITGIDNFIAAHLKCVLLPIGMDDHLFPILQLTQINKRSWQAIRQIDMARDHTVPIPGWEGAAFQPSRLSPQPGDIPVTIP